MTTLAHSLLPHTDTPFARRSLLIQESPPILARVDILANLGTTLTIIPWETIPSVDDIASFVPLAQAHIQRHINELCHIKNVVLADSPEIDPREWLVFHWPDSPGKEPGVMRTIAPEFFIPTTLPDDGFGTGILDYGAAILPVEKTTHDEKIYIDPKSWEYYFHEAQEFYEAHVKDWRDDVHATFHRLMKQVEDQESDGPKAE